MRSADLQAADWLARLQREQTPVQEHVELQRWLDESPANAVAFARAEFAWERAERLRAAAPRLQTQPTSRAKTWAIAATVAAAAVSVAVWYFATQLHVYTTDLGERRTVSLADGSQVNLNTFSRIAVDFDGQTRTIRLLQGEALFKVAPEPGRPFIVRAQDTQVRALGTAFNVRLRSEAVEVTVTEGLVAVDDKDRIAAGSAAVVAAGAVKRMALSGDVLRRRVAWRDGVIEFKGETLEQAVEEFNRYRKLRIVVADPTIATLRVGGRFETDEAVKFVNALKANFNIRAMDGEGGTLYLLGPE